MDRVVPVADTFLNAVRNRQPPYRHGRRRRHWKALLPGGIQYLVSLPHTARG